MPADPLLPDPEHLEIESLSVDAEGVIVLIRAKDAHARCPLCQRLASRVHSRYGRQVADVPWRGVAVRLRLHLRRFFCDTADCPRRIFAERLSEEVVAPYARRTARLTDMLRAVGLAAGGEGGARLLVALAMRASPDTLLRLLRSAPLPERPTPRVLGVDDWAKKRGQTYGTILVDLERHVVVDLLPDRTAEGLAAWLAQHPEIEIISRDRAGAYADGARDGAPDAVQVADRWHLLKNLGDALERVLERQHRALRDVERQLTERQLPAEAAATRSERAVEAPAPKTTNQEPEQPACRADQQREAHRDRGRQRVEEALAWHREGMTITAIGRTLGVTRKTVRRWLRAGEYRDRTPPPPRSGILAPYEDYLRQRWEEGCQNVAQLFGELRQRGYPGSHAHLRHHLARWRPHPARTQRSNQQPDPAQRRRPLTPRRVRWLLVRRAEELDDQEQQTVTVLEQHCPHVAEAHRLVTTFQTLLRERNAQGLDGWLQDAKASELPELRSFAQGIRRDRSAVEAALRLPWSQGQVEGQINKLKACKRAMFGRATFDLLRRRVLAGYDMVHGRRGSA